MPDPFPALATGGPSATLFHPPSDGHRGAPSYSAVVSKATTKTTVIGPRLAPISILSHPISYVENVPALILTSVE